MRALGRKLVHGKNTSGSLRKKRKGGKVEGEREREREKLGAFLMVIVLYCVGIFPSVHWRKPLYV